MPPEGFAAVFLVLAAADWWMDKVQRTTQLICRASGAPMSLVGEFLNPAFIKFSFPITLAKWGWVAVWAWYDSPTVALLALFASWLVTVVSPTPFRLTIPPVLKQIERVRTVDADVGDQLLKMVQTWKAIGVKR
jgi:H+/Cl- antiporter ClcA